jgi:hypothetical protein
MTLSPQIIVTKYLLEPSEARDLHAPRQGATERRRRRGC